MNEETNKRSELEAFFQKHLNADSTDNMGWDNPPPRVLDGAFKTLDEVRRKKRFMIWMWVFGGIGILAITSILVWNNNRLNNIDGKLSRLIENQENRQSVKAQRSEQRDFNESYGNNLSVEPSSIHQAPLTNNYSPIPSTIPVILENDVIASKSDSSSQNRKHQMNRAQDVNAPIANTTDTNRTNQTATDKVLPDSLAIVKGDILVSDDPPSKVILTDRIYKNAWYIKMGVNSSSLTMSALVPLGDNLTKYDNWYPGYQVGVGLTRNIKPKAFSLNFDLNYQVIRNKSIFKNESAYSKSNESIDNSGQPIYNATFGLESPIGAYTNELSINLNNLSFNDGDRLNNSTNITNKFHITSAKIGIGYALFSNHNLKLKAHFALGVNYVLEMKQNMNYKMSNQNTILTSSKFNQVSTKQMNNMFGSTSFGFSLEHKFKDNRFGGISTGYTRSLQSIRKVDDVMEVKTHLSLIQASFTGGIRF
jgi:hypothetical protein